MIFTYVVIKYIQHMKRVDVEGCGHCSAVCMEAQPRQAIQADQSGRPVRQASQAGQSGRPVRQASQAGQSGRPARQARPPGALQILTTTVALAPRPSVADRLDMLPATGRVPWVGGHKQHKYSRKCIKQYMCIYMCVYIYIYIYMVSPPQKKHTCLTLITTLAPLN